MRTCLNRLLGKCPDCKRDYENHYPNNLDCINYIETMTEVFEVREKEDKEIWYGE